MGLDYSRSSPRHLTIFQAWMDLLDAANHSVDIAAFYFTLRDSDTQEEEPSSWQVGLGAGRRSPCLLLFWGEREGVAEP